MTFRDAQYDLRRAYIGAGPGVFVSASVWLTAAFVERSQGIATAFAVLFIGGMLIYPLSTLICRLLFKRDKEAADNPLGATVLECTVAMIGGLFAAWLFLPIRPDYVFPLAAIAVGTHYAVFKTVYGDTMFWILGGLITAVGVLSVLKIVSFPGGPILAVAAIEMLFAVLLTMRAWGQE